MMGVSYRQSIRMLRVFRESGSGGLAHKLRGQPSNRACDLPKRAEVIDAFKRSYKGFGPTLASEMLEEREDMRVHRETLRRWLVKEGLWTERKRRRRHRSRRKRKERFGEMEQLDGSHHDWFEGRGPKCCLMTMVDDATGTVWALFTRDEGTSAAMRVLWAWTLQFGIPHSVYVDRLKTYITDREPTVEEQLAGRTPATQFGRACQKLGIGIIAAHSPQAKGRVENKHKLTQDRLIKEMRLNNISTIEEANEFLKTWLPKINRRFSVAAANPDDMHRAVRGGLDLRNVFCLEDTRIVKNDWIVQFDNQWLQILKRQSILPPAGAKVIVQNWLDGSLHVTYQGEPVVVKLLDAPPAKPARIVQDEPKVEFKPAHDHPWRAGGRPAYDLRHSNDQLTELADRLLGPVQVTGYP
jgi:transposase